MRTIWGLEVPSLLHEETGERKWW